MVSRERLALTPRSVSQLFDGSAASVGRTLGETVGIQSRIGQLFEIEGGSPPGDQIYLGPSTWPTTGWPARPTPDVLITGGNIKSQIAAAGQGDVIHIDINDTGITGVENLQDVIQPNQVIYGNGPTVTVFDGQHNLDLFYGVDQSDVSIFDIGIRRYRGYQGGGNGHGAIHGGDGYGGNRLRLDRVYTWENYNSGVRFANTGWYVTRAVSYDNGQYGWNEGGNGQRLHYWEAYGNGNANLPSGVPRYDRSDRGCGKFAFFDDLSIRYGWSHDHDDKGTWFDLNWSNGEIAYCRVERSGNKGIDLEAGHGPSFVHHNEAWDNGIDGDPSGPWWEPWMGERCQILISTNNDAQVYQNDVRGRWGIYGYQWDHPQYTNNPSWIGCLRGAQVYENYIEATVGNAGIIQLQAAGCATAYDTTSNRFYDNDYQGALMFGWDGWRDLSYWTSSLGYS